MKPLLLLACLAFLGAATPLKAQMANTLPQGEGRDLIATACSQCHALSIIMSMREGAAGWKRHVDNMVLRGTQLTASEAKTVIEYLATHFGPLAQPAGAAATAAPIGLPAGSEKELVEMHCAACHNVERISAVKRQKRDWEAIVADMLERFGVVAPEEAQKIVAYLTTHFGSTD